MFKKKLNELADMALEISGKKDHYTNKDFVNASLILMEVVSNKMYDYYNKKGMNIYDMCIQGEKMGQELRKLFIKHIGIDLHKAVKE
jgi:hypothetical protein